VTFADDMRALRPYSNPAEAAEWIGTARVCLNALVVSDADAFTRELAEALLFAMTEQHREIRERRGAA
jgi:hypothetical protein